MVNKQDKEEGRLSMRNSLIVWISGAILGWVVAVVSVWTALSTTDSNIAANSPTTAEKMEQIMPASGDRKDQPDK
ncbi:hypothetical protein MNBD_ALPHA02-276 [hydrothermal vent metagenome]|uniref:Uncharacterized protein n=1 Tax=hydrothermal vent metagenome TaxID=652676 RepID=A0A3B0R017_9ZZZZ